MPTDFYTMSVSGQGFLNLFVNLFLLTLVAGVLLIGSRKWWTQTRSFILLGVIVSYLAVTAWNVVFFGQPENRIALLSLSLPAIEPEAIPQQARSADVTDFDPLRNGTSLPRETNSSLEKPARGQHASWSRGVLSGASIAGTIWLLGSGLFLVGLLYNLLAVARFRRRLSRVTDGRLPALLQEVQSKLQWRAMPSLYVSAEIETPMTIGILHPAIVLPEKLLTVTSREEFLCILAHESAHIQHGDNLIGVLQRIFIASNWWNPLAYVISARYSMTREEICDDYALQMIDDSTRYTTCLVNLAEKSRLIGTFRPAVGLVGGKRNLTKRVIRILRKEQPVNTGLSTTKKWLLGGLCAAMILCCGGMETVFAQDFEAVERKLGEAVAEGNLSLEQAGVMMDALRRASTTEQDSGTNRAMAYLTSVRKELSAAVEAGEISREEAGKRFEYAEGMMRERIGFSKRVEDAIERGDLTREEANTKYREFAKRTGQKDGWEGFRKRVENAVERGDLTREEADAKYREFRQQRGEKEVAEADGSNRGDAYLIELRKELGAAVEAGKISREEAGKKFETAERTMRERIGFRKRVEDAVERGDLTRVEAEAKYREFGQGMAQRRDWEGFKKRVEDAVERGDLTHEQAEAKYREFRKQMGRER